MVAEAVYARWQFSNDFFLVGIMIEIIDVANEQIESVVWPAAAMNFSQVFIWTALPG